MRKFLDPRLDYSAALSAELRKPRISGTPIYFPWEVSSEDKGVFTYHFLGSKAGAEKVVRALEAKGLTVSLGALFHVFDKSLPIELSEKGSIFITPVEAQKMVDAREAAWREAIAA